jgi:hypothetical protein
MNILKKPIFWIVVGGVVFIALILILIPLTFPTVRTISAPDAEEVFTSFKHKIRFTRVGRHYQDLISQHSDELDKIYNEHPDHELHRANLLQLMQVFTPVMQDLIEGDGNKVQITQEQIDLLQTELDWIARQASPALRRDIEEEWQHFQLDIFAGMTLSEAMDFLAADLPPEVAAQPIQPTPLPTPGVTLVVPPVCNIGNDIDCLAAPSILPDSNGQWAYAILDGLYFEYPADWRVESSRDWKGTTRYLIPAEESVVGINTRGAYMTIRDNALSTDIPHYDGAMWSEHISLPDFEGEARMLKYRTSNARYILQAHLYDQDHARMVYFGAPVYGDQTGTVTPEILEENISRFMQMVQSVKIVYEVEPLPPATVGAPSAFVYPDTFWAEEIVNGVSFEYPHDSPMTRSDEPVSQTRSFVPEGGTLEALHVKETFFAVIPNVAVPENAPLDTLSCSTDPTTPQHDSLWHEPVILDDFEGSQFLWRDADGRLMYLEVVLYNRDLQKMICMALTIYPENDGKSTATPENARIGYPIFYHVLESIKLVDE